jgi:hypothetical protein
LRRSDLQADALSYMYAHEFVEQLIDEDQLYDPLAHSIEFPTKAPLSDKIIDRNEVAEKVVFCALADLHAQKRLIFTWQPIERLLGSHRLCRLAQRLGYAKGRLLVQRDGSFPRSPLNTAIAELFDSLLVPGSDFISEPRLPLRRLLTLLFRNRPGERDPYHEVLQWVGEELIEEGYYTDSTDVLAGATQFREAHPDLAEMRAAAPHVALLKERLARFERREPEIYGALKATVAQTIKELSILNQRRVTL